MNDSLFKSPPVTPFVECPNCKRLIEFGAERCPTCREEINSEYALASAIIIQHNTQACSLANMIKSAEPGAVMVLIASFAGYWLGAPSLLIVSFLTPLTTLSAIVWWFIKFGRFRIGDEEYAKAKREMRKSLKLWAALLTVQLLLLAYLLKTGI